MCYGVKKAGRQNGLQVAVGKRDRPLSHCFRNRRITPHSPVYRPANSNCGESVESRDWSISSGETKEATAPKLSTKSNAVIKCASKSDVKADVMRMLDAINAISPIQGHMVTLNSRFVSRELCLDVRRRFGAVIRSERKIVTKCRTKAELPSVEAKKTGAVQALSCLGKTRATAIVAHHCVKALVSLQRKAKRLRAAAKNTDGAQALVSFQREAKRQRAVAQGTDVVQALVGLHSSRIAVANAVANCEDIVRKLVCEGNAKVSKMQTQLGSVRSKQSGAHRKVLKPVTNTRPTQLDVRVRKHAVGSCFSQGRETFVITEMSVKFMSYALVNSDNANLDAFCDVYIPDVDQLLMSGTYHWDKKTSSEEVLSRASALVAAKRQAT